MAFRHRCSLDVCMHCVRGSGKGPKRCTSCGGRVHVSEGVYGVFEWRGDGRYRLEDAKAVRQTDAAADRYRQKYDPQGQTLVVRFVET